MSEEFSFRNWAAEGIKGARSNVHLPKAGIVPDEFRDHLKTSRKEFLLAFRSLFDLAIERCEKSKPLRRKGNTIKPE